MLKPGAAHTLRAQAPGLRPRALAWRRPSTVVPPGTMVAWSDPVDLTVPALADLAVGACLTIGF
jgi:hypothetical protein